MAEPRPFVCVASWPATCSVDNEHASPLPMVSEGVALPGDGLKAVTRLRSTVVVSPVVPVLVE